MIRVAISVKTLMNTNRNIPEVNEASTPKAGVCLWIPISNKQFKIYSLFTH